jgi:hypothetical protein
VHHIYYCEAGEAQIYRFYHAYRSKDSSALLLLPIFSDTTSSMSSNTFHVADLNIVQTLNVCSINSHRHQGPIRVLKSSLLNEAKKQRKKSEKRKKKAAALFGPSVTEKNDAVNTLSVLTVYIRDTKASVEGFFPKSYMAL